jgi:serine phosphatase RsbU (regulator of sigma subunit)
MSVTMLLGVLDLSNGAIRLVSAGHENPIQVTPDKVAVLSALEGGPPFAITEFPYPVETMALSAGDTLILLTDGITEAQNGSSALYGHERTLGGAAIAEPTATRICEAIRDDVRKFEDGNEATDDLTIMVIRYLGGTAVTSTG